MNTNTTPRQTRWGRSRLFGGGSIALVAVSVGIGAVLSSGIGGLFATFGNPTKPWLAFAVVAIVTLPVSAALAWVILVDRTTITGATRNPDDSIENIWFERAALGAFGDLMIVLGLGAAAFAVFGLAVAPALLLGALWVLGSVDFGVRYLAIRKAEG
jgi:MFS family permease